MPVFSTAIMPSLLLSLNSAHPCDLHPLNCRDTAIRHKVRIPAIEAAGMVTYLERPVAITKRSSDKVVGYTVPLSPVMGTSIASRYLKLMMEDGWPTTNTKIDSDGYSVDGSDGDNERDSSESWIDASASSPIKSQGNVVYMTSANIGGQDFQLVLDTGSSDTWLVTEPFQCLNNRQEKVDRKICKFSKPYKRAHSFVEDPTLKLRTAYADGEKLTGVMGTDTISIGGITVYNMTLGLVHEANWHGDRVSSGLLGMAFPSLTHAVTNTSFNISVVQHYDPVFFSMYKRGLIDPVFAVALNRLDEGPGALSLGGLPGGDIRFERDFARAPMEKLAFSRSTESKQDYSMYIVKADGFNVNGRKISFPTKVVIDTGTTLSFVPKPIMDAIAAAWDPPLDPASPVTGDYVAPCHGKAPTLALTIGGKQVWIDSQDLIFHPDSLWQVNCTLGVQASKGLVGAGFSMIGGSFMKSMVAVFDVGAAEMRFANRIRGH